MIKIAVYGKGGIGKSTTVSNVAAALAEMGLTVMQIGCDPKADSTIQLRHGEAVPTVLSLYNEKKQALRLEDMIRIGYHHVICVEAGGPTPGLGCAGRGIITALEKLKETGAYEVYKPDVILYDVLGDVVCGGFSMPMRNGYADKVFIITSGGLRYALQLPGKQQVRRKTMYSQTNPIGEREALTDLLNGEKNMITLYAKALMESSCPKMRTMVEQGLSQLAQDQYGVYANMSTRGYYTIKAATPQMISDAACQFESVKQQL